MASKRLVNRRLCLRLFLIIFILVFFSEVVVYHVNQWSWRQIQCKHENCTRILFVADPQLIGETYDTALYSPLAIYDSDRYLRKTFERANAFAQPDIICFLGDLLDEGEIATPYHYSNYVKRFKSIFTTENNIQRIHIPGDNDIGGENGGYVSNSNIHRFKKEFMYGDFFDFENRLRFFKITDMVNDFTNPEPESNVHRTRIGLSHMTLLKSGGSLLKGVLKNLDPHVIFSAHWHKSKIFLYPSQKSEEFYEHDVRMYDLDELKKDHTFLEIMVPTSSYRMGEYKMGYGYAVLDENILRYTVLWSNNRFMYLIVYAIWIIFASICGFIFVMSWCPFRLAKCKKQHRYQTVLQF